MYVHETLLRFDQRLTPCDQIFVDIGDKSWGVMACQRFFGGIHGSRSLHVGDQFLSAGANDFKVSKLCDTSRKDV